MGRADNATRGEVASLHLVVRGIVARGLFDEEAFLWVLREAEAEAVALDTLIRRAVLAERRALHAKDQAALRIAGRHIGVDGFVVLLVRGVGADAVVGLAILRIALATHGKAQARERQQIALIRRVDEQPRPHLGPIFKMQRRDPCAVLRHTRRFLQTMPA